MNATAIAKKAIPVAAIIYAAQAAEQAIEPKSTMGKVLVKVGAGLAASLVVAKLG